MTPTPEISITDGRPIYEAESPDELALVNAAFSYDICLVSRTPSHILVNAVGRGQIEFEVLKILPFDSNRKCMSVVVRQTGTQDIILYTKGADTSVMPVLAPPKGQQDRELREKTQQHLDLYAKQGLRVLVMAKRHMKSNEFNEWEIKHKQIELSMEHNREKKIRESFSMLEQNLVLLGATGIEDRLQEGVPEAITSLRKAGKNPLHSIEFWTNFAHKSVLFRLGIAIWVLTGDKPETAINIAYSAKLFQPNMELLR